MVPGVIIDDARHPPKNTPVKNFTSTDFLGPIKFDSPIWGDIQFANKKNVNSPFKKKAVKEMASEIVNFLVHIDKRFALEGIRIDKLTNYFLEEEDITQLKLKLYLTLVSKERLSRSLTTALIRSRFWELRRGASLSSTFAQIMSS